MSGEREHAPIDPDIILEGIVAIDSEVALESVQSDDDKSHSPSATEGNSSTSVDAAFSDLVLGSEVASNPNTEVLEAGLEKGKELKVEQSSSVNEDDDQAERAPSDPTVAGDETTSSNEKFELGENVLVLRSKSTAPGAECSVYIVGTAHVSQESCDEVKAVIHHVKPRVVFLELCSSRVALLVPRKLQVPTLEEMVDMYRKKDMNPFGIIYSWFLARVAEKLEMYPGSEFRVAYEEAFATGARVVLGDRPIQITLKRTWARLNTWHKTKLIFGMIFQGFFVPSAEELSQLVEDMKGTDMMTAIIQEMSKDFPTLMDTLVHERDLYMTAALRGIAQNTTSVVAVVGKGHLLGMEENWEKDISIEELLIIPEKKSSWFSLSVIRWGTIAVAVGGLAVFVRAHYKKS